MSRCVTERERSSVFVFGFPRVCLSGNEDKFFWNGADEMGSACCFGVTRRGRATPGGEGREGEGTERGTCMPASQPPVKCIYHVKCQRGISDEWG